LASVAILAGTTLAGNLKFLPNTIFCDLNGYGYVFGNFPQLNTRVQNLSKDSVTIVPAYEFIASPSSGYPLPDSTEVWFQFSQSKNVMIFQFDSNFVTSGGREYRKPTLLSPAIPLAGNQVDTFGGFELGMPYQGQGNLALGVPYRYASNQTLVRLVFSTGPTDFDTLTARCPNWTRAKLVG
jgi:hypothetical protein